MSVRVKRRIMTKRDIVRIVSEESGVKQSSGMVAVNLILCEIKRELLRGNKVAIHNFGVFKKKYRWKFKPSPRLHEATNNPDYDFTDK